MSEAGVSVTTSRKLASQTDSRQGAGSSWTSSSARLGGELVNRGKLGIFQIGAFLEDLLLSHSGTQPSKNIPDSYSQAADSRFPRAFSRFDCDSARAHLSACPRHLRRLLPLLQV